MLVLVFLAGLFFGVGVGFQIASARLNQTVENCFMGSMAGENDPTITDLKITLQRDGKAIMEVDKRK